MTPHTAGVAACTACISRAGVLWSNTPTSRNVKLMMLTVIAFSGSAARPK